jgi:coniferyl-aldehyde dehydrogenase
MNAATNASERDEIAARMTSVLQAQREDYLREGQVSPEARIDRIDRSIDVLTRYANRLDEALNSDFTCRPRQVNMIADVAGSIGAMKHSRKHLRKWMRAQRRPSMFPLGLLGARSRIEYQPLGVVGIIAPWNFPVAMVFHPMSGALAAGNRIMIKPSEYTPATSEVIDAMVKDAFDITEIAVFTGGPDVGVAFSNQPFDHLIFTGATSTARHIMAAAAQNLVPVTLELGGKNPVVISRTADLEKSLGRIMMGKTLNAGQICAAPDYLLVPEEKLEDIIVQAQQVVAAMYPKLLDNPQYTSMINDRHYQRLNGYIDEAEKAGARVITINPGNENFSGQQRTFKIPPTLVVEPSASLKVLQDEMFGPVLPMLTYDNFEETIDYINTQPRALAAYYFGFDAAEQKALETRTTSGGMCINDVIMQVSQEDLPFGGVGPSGMGNYHGLDGFRTFSHAKSIFSQTGINIAKLGGMVPPYNKTTEKNIASQLGNTS